MDLNKVPRWALIGISGLGLAAITLVANETRAKAQETTKIAWQAKNTADKALDGVAQLQAQVADVRGALELNRKEYRDDRIRDAEQLRSMEDRIIRAVKA